MNKNVLGSDGNPIQEKRKRKLNRRDILIGIAAFVAALAAFLGNIKKIIDFFRKLITKPTPEATYQYMRLFGALQVPVVIEGINNNKCQSFFNRECTVDEIDEDQGNQSFRFGFFNFGQALTEWKNAYIDDTPASEAYVLLDPIWKQEVIDNLFKEFDEANIWSTDHRYWKIIYGDSQDARTYFECLDPFTPGNEKAGERCQREIKEQNIRYNDSKGKKYTPYVRQYGGKKLEPYLKKIGYLFLIIENKSSSEIRNIEIKYVIVNNTDIGNSWLPNTQVQKELDDKKKNKGEYKSLYIPTLVEKKKAFLCLGGYKANEKSYAEKYFTSCICPLSLSWKQNNRLVKVELEKPKEDEAAKKILPIGWYGQ